MAAIVEGAQYVVLEPQTVRYTLAIVKFNGGRGALLCNKCNHIIALGSQHEDRIYTCDACERNRHRWRDADPAHYEPNRDY